jgi:hypothetical protein
MQCLNGKFVIYVIEIIEALYTLAFKTIQIKK